ncbi:ComEA family DNA-binding protein [Bacteroidota bacterium]
MKRIGITILLLCFLINGYSQEEDISQEIIESLIEEFSDLETENIIYEQLYNDLTVLLNNPVNINSSTREELERLIFFSEKQITEIIEYRSKYGVLLSAGELQIISGLTKESIIKIMPFILFADKDNKTPKLEKEKYKKSKNTIIIRSSRVLEKKSGFFSKKLCGDTWKHYFKYRYDGSNFLNFGITAEKDPGEQFFRESQKYGYDYYSAFIEINPDRLIKKIVIGDFVCQFGQGSVIWNGFSGGKNSSRLIDINKRAGGIKPYSSSTEYGFFRGAGIMLKKNNINLNTFISYRKIDAKIEIVSDTFGISDRTIKTIYTTGFHRTESEMEHKNSSGELVYGCNINYRKDIYSVGVSFAGQKYDDKLLKEVKPYNIMYRNYWKTNYFGGLDYMLISRKLTLYGEFSVSRGGGSTFLNGLIYYPFSGISFSMLYRTFAPHYHSAFAKPFSEGNKSSNEKGFYFGIELQASKKLKISGYVDNFSFPWLKFLVDAPSSGSEYFISLENNFNENINFVCQFRSEKKEKNITDNQPGLKKTEIAEKRYFRNQLEIKVPFNKFDIILRNRLEFSTYKTIDISLQKGWLFYQDILFRPQELPIGISFRYCIFNIENYNNRIYTYEQDVQYSFSIPAFFDRGYRYYLCLKYKLSKRINFQIKYGITKYPEKESIGTGIDEIAGNRKSEINMLLRIKI